MSKLKTHKGTAGRFKLTGRGKIVYHKGGRRHLLTGKSSKTQRPLRRLAVVDKTNEYKLRRLLPGNGPAR